MLQVTNKRAAGVFVVAALMLSACGSSDPTNDTTDPGDDAPAVAGACLEGVVDCDDTAVIGDPDGPVTTDDGAVVGDPMGPMQGFTVDEALASDGTETVGVRGLLFDDGSGLRLCSVFAESYPPQCAGSYLTVEGYGFDRISELDPDERVEVAAADGVTWTEGAVTLFGVVNDGVLVVG